MNKSILSYLIIAVISLTTAFTSCTDDNKSSSSGFTKLDVKVENGNQYNSSIDVVKLMAEDEDEFYTELASGTYTNGGFSINLPSVENNLLSTLFDEEDEEDVVFDLKISNKSVKGGSADLGAYKDESAVGYFWYGKMKGDECVAEGMLVYVNGDVTIKGTVTYRDDYDDEIYTRIAKYNVSLKKGWNYMFATGDESKDGKTYTITITTSNPGGMQWYFEDDYYDYDYDYDYRMPDPYTRRIGIGFLMGTNTFVDRYTTGMRSFSQEGLLSVGGIFQYRFLEGLIAQFAYTYSKNNKLFERLPDSLKILQ